LRRIDLSVIAPCFNEEPNVSLLTSRLLAVFERRQIAGEIVLVDDCSTDGTGPLIDDLAVRHPEVVAIHHQQNQGLSASWDSGLLGAHGTYVCFIDADLQNPPEEVWRLYREITQSHADVVQGVRSAIGRLKDGRYLTSRTLNVILNLVFGMSAADNKSGFVMALRETMTDVLRRRFRYKYSHVFIGAAAHAKGFRIREVETLFQNRHAGESFIKRWPVRLTAEVCLETAKAFVEFRLGPERVDALDHFLHDARPMREPDRYQGRRRLLLELYFLSLGLQRPLLTHRVRRIHHALLRTQWMAVAEVRRLQELRLGRIIRHAYHHVPYYREVFDRLKVRPEEIQTQEDLGRLPLLSRRDVSENVYFDLFADNHRKKEMVAVKLGGCGDAPFDVYNDRTQLEMRLAGSLRELSWAGGRLFDRAALPGGPALGGTWRHRLGKWLESAFLRRLTVPAAGDEVGRAFAVYGAPPFSGVACECEEHDGHHVAAESYVVEIVKDGRPARAGETGEIVVTDLNSFSLPLLRYRTGDFAAAGDEAPCRCGRGLPRIRPLPSAAPAAMGQDERV
jgi:phenylacetate-CoA ligase